jgi:hypothetical protein
MPGDWYPNNPMSPLWLPPVRETIIPVWDHPEYQRLQSRIAWLEAHNAELLKRANGASAAVSRWKRIARELMDRWASGRGPAMASKCAEQRVDEFAVEHDDDWMDD